MNIVPLDAHNAHLLDNVAADVFDNAIEPSQLQVFLDCPRHVMVLAVEDGIVVGIASGVEYFHPDKAPQLWINEVGVTPTRRNQGIGRQLVRALMETGTNRGCVSAWLGTERDNLPAQRCFGAVANGDTPQVFLLYEWDIAGNVAKWRDSPPHRSAYPGPS
jgi:aminoglycoside 6'-N-acetyltransferase I